MRRRDFLKATTLAAGVGLLEACGSPEEQYLLQPVRRSPLAPLPGESVWRNGVCAQCGAGCGIQVRVVDGNAKKIEGAPDHPINGGGVCALGHSLLQEIYNPDRILTPLRRAGERGAGAFEVLSWEDALAAMVEAVAGTDPAAMAFVGADRTGLTGALWRRLADALGAPPPVFVEAQELAVERRAARISLGVDDVPYFDIGRADYVLSIGAPFLDRWHSPVHYTAALARMRQGRPGRRGKLVHAEARMSLTAASADEWLAVRPGAEGILARTMAGALQAEGGVDADNVERYRRIFPAPAPSLEEGAAACGVAADKIRRAAAELAAAEHKVVIAGGPAAAHSNGVSSVAAGLALNVLLGTLGEPGGVFAPVSLGLEEGVAAVARGSEASAAAAEPASVAELAARLRGEAAAVDLLVVADADPLHTLPASWGLRQGLASIDRIVILSSFRDDTAIHADLLLPLNSELERFNAVVPATSIGVPVLSLCEPVVEPLGDGRHPADVVLALAAALGEPVAGMFPWPSFTRFVETRLGEEMDRLPGADATTAAAFIRAAVARGGVFGAGPPSVAPPGGAGPVEEPGVAAFDGAATEYPFVLLPFASIKFGDGRGANRPWLQELPDPLSTVMWDGWLEISPPDAADLGVQDGDLLRVASASGSVEAYAVIDPALRPGVVGMPLGLGYEDYGRYARGRGANPMNLIGRLEVEGSAAPAWASTRVVLKRIGPGSLARFGRSYTEQGAGENIPVGWAPMSATPEKLG